MSRGGWWIPTLLASVAHAGFLAVPLQFEDDTEAAEQRVTLRIEAPEPEPEPPEPEPPPEPPPPEDPPPEPPPKPPPRIKRSDPPPEPPPEPPPPEPSEPPEPPPAPHVDTKPLPSKPEAAVKVPPARKVPKEPGPSQADFRAYAKNMRSKFLRHRRYPPAALRTRLEGVAKVKLSVDRRGRLVGQPSVVKSSGHAVLDAEALRVVRVAAPFAPLPKNSDKEVMVFVIPIDFSLTRG